MRFCQECDKAMPGVYYNQKYDKTCAEIVNKRNQAASYRRNKELCDARNKQWLVDHPGKAREYYKRWIQKPRAKELSRIKVRRWAKNNPEKIKAHRQTERYKWLNRELKIKERKKYPERMRARRMAVNNILIEVDRLCEICAVDTATERHHPDYSKPLDVQFLCMPCHKKLHRKELVVLGGQN